MELTADISLRRLYERAEFAQARGCLISRAAGLPDDDIDMTLAQLQEKHPAWDTGDMLYGLQRVMEAVRSKEKYVCPVYSPEKVKTDSRLEQVKLLTFMAKEKRSDTWAILLAGGAYGSVCTLVESLPVAAKLNELGIDCFCLNYRTADSSAFECGLLPQPLEDLAASIRFVDRQFGLDPTKAIVGGFSAGGHVAALWGTEHLGARHYGLPQPKGLLLAYPLITMANMPDSPVKQMLCSGMFGRGWTQADIDRYDVSIHGDTDYPRTYLVGAADDTTVSVKDGDSLAAALKRVGVPCRVERSPTGGHGFGLGTATPMNGWVARALSFLEGNT